MYKIPSYPYICVNNLHKIVVPKHDIQIRIFINDLSNIALYIHSIFSTSLHKI